MQAQKVRKDYDVIIAGAGPAGCSCALALKDAGLTVALLDKYSFPRDKICGDAIPGRAIKTLTSISPEFTSAFTRFPPKNLTKKTRIHFNGQHLEFDWAGEAYTCARMEFDDFLFTLVKEQTACDVYTACTISTISADADGVSVADRSRQITFTGKMIIGADGANSVVARQLTSKKLDRNHHVASVRAYYSGIRNTADNTTEVYLDKKYLPSYLWVFPLPGNTANVGFGMLSAEITKRKINIKDSFYEFINNTPELAARFINARQIGSLEGFGLPLGSKKEIISGNNFMLVGDAASLIDPVSGDGIGNAMLSGKLAADQIVTCFAKSDFSATCMKNYDKLLFGAIGNELKFRFRVQRAISHMPALINMVFWAGKNKMLNNIIRKQL